MAGQCTLRQVYLRRKLAGTRLDPLSEALRSRSMDERLMEEVRSARQASVRAQACLLSTKSDVRRA